MFSIDSVHSQIVWFGFPLRLRAFAVKVYFKEES